MMLRRTIPMFPVGHWIEVLTGRHPGLARGGFGAVAGRDAPPVDPPAAGRSRHRVPTPVDLDLRTDDSLEIRGLAPGEAPFELGVAVWHRRGVPPARPPSSS